MNSLTIFLMVLIFSYILQVVVNTIGSIIFTVLIVWFFISSVNGDKNIYYWYEYMKAKRGII